MFGLFMNKTKRREKEKIKKMEKEFSDFLLEKNIEAVNFYSKQEDELNKFKESMEMDIKRKKDDLLTELCELLAFTSGQTTILKEDIKKSEQQFQYAQNRSR